MRQNRKETKPLLQNKDNKAVFLDRDGVINRLVLNPETGELEAPKSPADLDLYPETPGSLRKLGDMGYLLYIVSNQPDYAKGKAGMENLRAVHEALQQKLEEGGIAIVEYFYCYHHPEGIVPGLSIPCQCRKPGTLFPRQAIEKYSLQPEQSWFIGDKDSDILCGQACGLRTILLLEECSSKKRGNSSPDYICNNLEEAVKIIETKAQGIILPSTR